MSRRSVVVIDDFYPDPDAVRAYALRLQFYTPYEDGIAVQNGTVRASWWASRFTEAYECPFKASASLIAALEHATGEPIDLDHWKGSYAVDANSKPRPLGNAPASTCLWNCSFHVKPDNGQQLGNGVHNHVTDHWNGVGRQGWAGIVYLSPDAPLNGGLHLWRNVDKNNTFDWMTPAHNWELIDSFGNVYNRLVLVRGDIPHSGARGWGQRIEEGRLYQTFFFRTTTSPPPTVEVQYA